MLLLTFGGSMIARITEKGQVTIPKQIRSFLGITYGDAVDFKITRESVIIEKEAPRADARNLRGILPTKRKFRDSYIKKAKSAALAKEWNKK